MGEDEQKKTEQIDPAHTWKDGAMLVIVLLVLIFGIPYSCSVASGYRSEYDVRAEQAARVAATACVRDGSQRRYDCVEACRLSTDQIACIDEVNKLVPMYLPNLPSGGASQ